MCCVLGLLRRKRVMYDRYSQLGDLRFTHREPGGAVGPGWATYYSMSSFLLLSAVPLQCFGSCQGRSRSDGCSGCLLYKVFLEMAGMDGAGMSIWIGLHD